MPSTPDSVRVPFPGEQPVYFARSPWEELGRDRLALMQARRELEDARNTVRRLSHALFGLAVMLTGCILVLLLAVGQ